MLSFGGPEFVVLRAILALQMRAIFQNEGCIPKLHCSIALLVAPVYSWLKFLLYKDIQWNMHNILARIMYAKKQNKTCTSNWPNTNYIYLHTTQPQVNKRARATCVCTMPHTRVQKVLLVLCGRSRSLSSDVSSIYQVLPLSQHYYAV